MRWALALLLLLTGCGSAPLAETKAPIRELFHDATEEAGVRFEHYPAGSREFFMPEIMGSGAALLDYDNDGDLDLFLIQGKPLAEGARPPEEVLLGNRFFRNETGPDRRLQFKDVTREAGLSRVMYGMGAATGDYDNDGFVDLYVTGFGPNALFHNDGNGRFTEVTNDAGVQDDRWSTSAAFLDYDRDGDLDLLVLNYVDFTVAGNKACTAPSGERDYCTPKAYRPVPARLFRNEGGGKFKDVTMASRIATTFGPGLGVTCADFNGDGWIDIYVANDTAANLLWINQRDGTFTERGLASGAAYSEDGLAKAGMGVTAGDYDNDGDEDVFVVNLTREGATLFANDGKGGFQDVSLRTGLRPATFAFTGFGTEWFDFDNDGRLDLFIANGAVTLMESLRGSPWPFQQKNSLLHNAGDGRFEDWTPRAGRAFELAEVSRGAAFGDLDNDGDVDIVVTNNNGPARILRNELETSRGWLTVQLQGAKSNHTGLGARVGLERAGKSTLWRRVHSDSSYLSASDPRAHFGLRDGADIAAVVVEWPDGSRERWTEVAAGRIVKLTQGTGRQ